MFLVIPIVEFLHVLGVDINVHHENPATFLCHVSVSSVKRSRHLPRLVGTRSSRLEPSRDTRHQLGSHLSTRPRRVRQPRRTPCSPASPPAQRVAGWGKA